MEEGLPNYMQPSQLPAAIAQRDYVKGDEWGQRYIGGDDRQTDKAGKDRGIQTYPFLWRTDDKHGCRLVFRRLNQTQ